jgi:hypothetical protein
MKNLKDRIIEIINDQKFFDAAQFIENKILDFSVNCPNQEETVQNLISQIKAIKNKISTTQVINPQQYDDLYAYVYNNVTKVVDEALNIPDFKKNYNQNLPEIKRVIIGGNCALCMQLFTKDNIEICFSFDFEALYPEYEQSLVKKYPDCFYLEDNEVLSVKSSAQYGYNLQHYLKIAQDHPLNSIDIINSKTKISYITNNNSTIFEQHFEEWYWKKNN